MHKLQHNPETLAALLMQERMSFHGQEPMSREHIEEMVLGVVGEVKRICEMGRLGSFIDTAMLEAE